MYTYCTVCIHMFISTTVISEPDDVTVCEGRSTTFICVLNGSMNSSDVQWYRKLKDTGTTERIGRWDDFIVVPLPGTNSFTTRLLISNPRRSYTGYYWVSSPLGDVCNTSFTVSTSKYVCIHTYTHMHSCYSSLVTAIVIYRAAVHNLLYWLLWPEGMHACCFFLIW